MPLNYSQFGSLNETRPIGSQYVSIVDDYLRETRKYIKDSLALLCGFPDNNALRICTWQTNTRPLSGLVDGIFGYNSETKRLEYYDSGTWKNIYLRVDNALSAGDESDPNNIKSITITCGNTLSRPTTANNFRNIHFNTQERLIQVYFNNAWSNMGAWIL